MGQHLLHREALVLKALANPKRLEILQVLSHEALTLTELQEMTGMSQTSLSQNVKILKLAQIITADRNGRTIEYHLAHPNFALMKTLLHQAISQKSLVISRKVQPVPKVKDVVCGMKVVPSSAEWKTIHKGATYYFCASGCLHKFTKEPEVYVKH